MENNQVQVFNNEKFGDVRVIMQGEQPWFVGKDVASVLGYTNERKAIHDHVEEEDKLTERIVTAGQKKSLDIYQ